MKFIKKNKLYDCMSESKTLIKSKNWFIDIQEYYGRCHTFTIRLWIKDKNEDEIFINKRHVVIPLNLYAFYIIHIYKHLGICHKDLRSKFYIGKPIECREEK